MPFYKRYQYPIFILILLLAAASRILHIDAESLWVDEGFSYWAIRHDHLFTLLKNDVHPPLYFYMLRGWAGVAGISELALRYFSVIPSLLSVVVVYHTAKELERGRRGGDTLYRETIIPTLAALLMALADMESYVAQEARMYTWHVLWAAASMWAFLRWIRLTTASPHSLSPVDGSEGLRSVRIAQIAWFTTTLLLLFTQYVGLAAVGVQGLYTLIFLRGRKRIEAIGTLAVIGVIFGAWFILIAGGQTENIGTGFNVPSTLESLWNFRDEWFTQQWALMMGLAILGLVIVIYPYPQKQQEDDLRGEGSIAVRLTPFAPSFLMLGWFAVPVALMYILNYETPILMDYRLTQITPAVALMIAFGLGNLPKPTTAFLVTVIVVYGVAINDTPRPRPPWREVGENAARYAEADDLALALVTPSGDWQVMYYYERLMPEVERRSLRQWQLEDGDTYAQGLPALLEEYPHVWFMQWSKDMSGFEALDATGHTQTAVMTEDWLGNDLNVYRYDVVSPLDERVADYDNGMILRDATTLVDQLRVDLWWSADRSLDADYTVSAILLDGSGRLVAQDDAYPFVGERPTSAWKIDDVIYDPHELSLVEGVTALPAGEYSVGVKVYLWSPEGITIIPTMVGEEFAVIGTIQVANEG
jgi:hypothetical protein